jgi:polysaccharide biosynthesis transport protein
MSLNQLLAVMRARWRAGAAVLGAILALVTLLSMALPKQYTASAVVVVEPRTSDPIAGVATPNAVAPGYMATQIDVIGSERVLIRALRSLGVHENAEAQAQWQQSTEGKGSFESWLAERLGKKLVVKPSRESNALSINYTTTDRNIAANTVNAVVRAYMATALDMRVEPAKDYNAFFDKQAAERRAALALAQGKLSEYQRQKGVVFSTERLDIENQRLVELSSQLVVAQGFAMDSRTRTTQSDAYPERTPEALTNLVVSGLGAELGKQQARLQELRSRLGEKHPQVIELRASIDELQSRVNAATARAAGSVGVNNSVTNARVAELRTAITEQQARVLSLKTQNDQAALLKLDVDAAQRAYDAVMARVTQTSLESRNLQSNVSVLKEATPPAQPTSPQLMLNLGISAVLGTMLAAGAMLLAERRDRRLRSVEDVVLDLQQPLLVVLKAAHPQRRERSRKQKRQIEAQIVKGAQPALPH